MDRVELDRLELDRIELDRVEKHRWMHGDGMAFREWSSGWGGEEDSEFHLVQSILSQQDDFKPVVNPLFKEEVCDFESLGFFLSSFALHVFSPAYLSFVLFLSAIIKGKP